MNATNSAMLNAGSWADFHDVTHADVSPSPVKRHHAPVNRSQGLLTDDEILDASFWRLDCWTAEEIDAGCVRLTRLLEMGIPLDSSNAEVAEMMEHLPGDRRSPWSAMLALAVLYADSIDNSRLFMNAGHELMGFYRQSQRARSTRSGDPLSLLIAEYLAVIPDIMPHELWNDFTGQAHDGFHEVLADFDGYTLSFNNKGVLDYISYSAFARRVQRARFLLNHMQQNSAE